MFNAISSISLPGQAGYPALYRIKVVKGSDLFFSSTVCAAQPVLRVDVIDEFTFLQSARTDVLLGFAGGCL